MNNRREKTSLPLQLLAVFLAAVLLGASGVSAKNSTIDVTQSILERKTGLPMFVGNPDDQTSKITPFGTRAARLAQSNQYLAVVYQQGSTIRLRSTKKTGAGAWIRFPPVLGSGAAPSLVFSDDTTVHVVWVDTNQRLIYHVSCTLTVDSASCGTPASINSNTNQTVESPGITFLSGKLYVAWINSSAGRVIVARSANGGSSWQFNSTVLGATASSGGTVALAASSGIIHLAYSYSSSAKIKYYRSTDGITWSNNRDFVPDTSYLQVSNPTIEATGNYVYLAWDSMHNAFDLQDGFRKYSLMGVLSTNGGINWVDSSGNPSANPVPRYITSNHAFGSGTSDDQRRTRNVSGATPSEEAGLRPSVALTEQNKFAVVWQERPNVFCQADQSGNNILSNGTSEIYYGAEADPGTANSSGWWSSEVATVENPSISHYSIDPDMVIDSGGDRHIVFMKSPADTDSENCQAGGGESEYAIYYRGPYYTTIDPDRVFLPVILN